MFDGDYLKAELTCEIRHTKITLYFHIIHCSKGMVSLVGHIDEPSWRSCSV